MISAMSPERSVSASDGTGSIAGRPRARPNVSARSLEGARGWGVGRGFGSGGLRGAGGGGVAEAEARRPTGAVGVPPRGEGAPAGEGPADAQAEEREHLG